MSDCRQRASQIITTRGETIAEKIMALHFQREPELIEAYGAREKALYIRDTRHHLDALAAAFVTGDPSHFGDHMAQVSGILLSYKISTEGLPRHMQCMEEVLRELLPEEALPYLHECVEAALQKLL